MILAGRSSLLAQAIVKIIFGIVAALRGVVQCKEIGVAVLGVIDAETGSGEFIIRARNSLVPSGG